MRLVLVLALLSAIAIPAFVRTAIETGTPTVLAGDTGAGKSTTPPSRPRSTRTARTADLP